MRVVQQEGIQRPTKIRTDKNGKWLVVIQKDGDEIRNYKIKDVGALFLILFGRYFSVWHCRKNTASEKVSNGCLSEFFLVVI